MENSMQIMQKIEIVNRQTIDIFGAEEVLSSTEKEVFVKMDKDILQVLGEGLKIVKLMPEEKVLVINGKVNGFAFTSKMSRKSLFGKVFK